jgi:hypothetical protein
MLIKESKLRAIIRSVLAEGIYDPGILKAVFMAGGPGSGKSFTAKSIFGGDPKSVMNISTASGLKIVNSDPAFEKFLEDAGIDPKSLGSMSDEEFKAITEPADSPRGRAKRVKKASQAVFTRGDAKLGVIIDGTGDDFGKISRKKEELEKLGYDTYMVFVNTTLDVAQERNANRDRVLKRDLVEKIWTDVQKNLGGFQKLFGANNIQIVDNTVYGPLPDDISKAVNQFLSAPIRNPIGRKWIEGELGQRGGGTKRERSKLLGDKRRR